MMYRPPVLHHSCTEDITSRSSCSSSGSEQEESDAEGDKDSTEDEEAEEPQKADREETVVAPDQTGEPSAEETSAADAECAVANSAGDSTEIDISDSSIPSGNEMKQSDDTSGDTEVAEMVRGSNRDAEQERGECKTDKCWIFPLSLLAELQPRKLYVSLHQVDAVPALQCQCGMFTERFRHFCKR